jgi:hypothetical protein
MLIGIFEGLLKTIQSGCSADFHRVFGENLFGAPVEVSGVSTILSGGEYCQMCVKLPVA